jgi:hypothetical protein
VWLALTLVVLLAQTTGQAAPPQPQLPDALPYSRGFLVTGNYITASVDLTSQANPADAAGYATGTIPINDAAVAGGAYLVGAYLYFEAVHPFLTNAQGVPLPVPEAADPTFGIKFRGTVIPAGALRVSSKHVTSGGATCWGAAGQGSFAVSMFRANVLSLMPKQYDVNGNWTGKYIVNSSELAQDAQHTVTLREKTGDSAIQTGGATLFLVYRSTDAAEPLRKIVVYDGLYTAYNTTVSSSTAEMETMSQKIRGFYKSAGSKARITHLVGTGGNNQTEKISVTSKGGTVTIGPPPVSADPFPQTSPNSDRSWTAATYALTSVMPGITTQSDRYGETVTTTVQASNSSPAACRAWGAVFFSTDVLDFDNDGLPDGVEDASGGLRDPNGVDLPNLNAMGAKSKNANDTPHPDLFVEINAMWAAGDDPATSDVFEGTTYGSTSAPYPNTTADCYDPDTKACADAAGHHHFPTPADLKKIGDRYAAQGITAHFDVGDVTAYHGLGTVPHADWVDNYASTEADAYLVGNGVGANVATLARGGEVIREVACSTGEPECLFPDYPGTVGWKIGLLALRNAPVGNSGQELNPDLSDPDDPTFDWLGTGSQHRLRFDRERRPFMHYILGAHTRGTPSSPFPCLVSNVPSPYTSPGSCGANNAPNPAYHVPSGSGGLADLPGRNVLVTMGLWDELVGRPYSRQATIFHELGHNLNLWHSGTPATFGNAQTATSIEPNCKPNYFSTMSYLYQLHGLFNVAGQIQLDYSHAPLSALDENGLADGEVVTSEHYRAAWFAPASSDLATAQEAVAAARFCSGVRFGPGEPAEPMARVESDTFDDNWYIDWDGDQETAAAAQDANFDGSLSTTLSPYNDWANIRLNQISANGITGGSDDFVFMVGSDELAAIIGSDDFVSIIGSDELAAIIGGDDLVAMIGGDELAFMIGSDDFVSLIGSDDFVSIIGGDDLSFIIGGDDFTFIIGGDDLAAIIGGDDLAAIIGSDDQEEITYRGAQDAARGAPYELTACIVGEADCVTAQPYTPEYHRTRIGWTASTVGHVDHYQVQRKRTGAPDASYETASALIASGIGLITTSRYGSDVAEWLQ